MSETDTILVALMKLTPEERMGVLELLPEWQRVTRPNELRTIVRREVLDALIDVTVGARKSALEGGDWLTALTRECRDRSAKLRTEERTKQ